MRLLLIITYLFIPLLCSCQPNNVSTRDSMKSFTYKLISKALKKRRFKKIAVWDFTDPQRNSSSIATYIAQQISSYATDIDSVIVLDRQNIESLLREHKLQDKDLLIDPKALLKLGEFTGTEVLIVGKVAVFERECSIQLNLRIVDVNTAHIIAAIDDYIPVDKRFADVSGLALNCQGLGADVAGKPGRGFSRLSESNEGYNNPQQLKEGGCDENNTGVYCFYNTTTQNLNVVVSKAAENANNQANDWLRGPKDEFKLKPQESKCIYNLSGGNSYKFIVVLNNTDDQRNTDNFDSGSILIEKCKSKTYTIKNSVTTETKKATDKLFKQVTESILQKGIDLIKDKLKIKDN